MKFFFLLFWYHTYKVKSFIGRIREYLPRFKKDEKKKYEAEESRFYVVFRLKNCLFIRKDDVIDMYNSDGLKYLCFDNYNTKMSYRSLVSLCHFGRTQL